MARTPPRPLKTASAPPIWRGRKATRSRSVLRRSPLRQRPCLANRGTGLHAHAGAELPRLAAGNLALQPVAKLNVQSAPVAELHTRDEIEVDDLAPVGAEEAPRIELVFKCRERPAQQRPVFPPMQAHVVAFGGEDAHFAKRHEPAAGAIAYED